MKNEPVILLTLAKVAAAALVGAGLRLGLHLDMAEVIGAVLVVETAFVGWIRSKVSPAAKLAAAQPEAS